MTGEPITSVKLAEQLRDLLRRISGKCTNEEAGRWCLGFIVMHGDDLADRLAQARTEQPAQVTSEDRWTITLIWAKRIVQP